MRLEALFGFLNPHIDKKMGFMRLEALFGFLNPHIDKKIKCDVLIYWKYYDDS